MRPPTVRAATDTVTTCDESTLRSVINGDTVNFSCSGTNDGQRDGAAGGGGGTATPELGSGALAIIGAGGILALFVYGRRQRGRRCGEEPEA